MDIKFLVTDVDGVLTDGKFTYTPEGKVSKIFGPHDSDGFKLLLSEGVSIKAITADSRGFPISKKRLDDMGIELFLVKEKDRLEWIKNNTDIDKTAFIGDGLYDIPSMKFCKLSFAPDNALDIAKPHADIVTRSKGGEGVILEVALEILKIINPNKLNSFNDGEII